MYFSFMYLHFDLFTSLSRDVYDWKELKLNKKNKNNIKGYSLADLCTFIRAL